MLQSAGGFASRPIGARPFMTSLLAERIRVAVDHTLIGAQDPTAVGCDGELFLTIVAIALAVLIAVFVFALFSS